MLKLKDLVLKNRSYRRWLQQETVAEGVLRDLIDLARLSPSAGNLQPLKYIISCDTRKNGLIFPYLSWAAYLKDWPGPAEGERPAAYIVILGDTRITDAWYCNHGIAAQSILLGAVEKGLGGCIIGLIDRNGLRKALKIEPCYKILLVLALGRPREEVIIEKVCHNGDIKYWRDCRGGHHVPKRQLDDIIVNGEYR